jgi:hypothetical protein
MQAFRDGSSSVADFCLRERQSRNVVARFSASACVGGSLICYVNVTRDAGVHERPSSTCSQIVISGSARSFLQPKLNKWPPRGSLLTRHRERLTRVLKISPGSKSAPRGMS